MSQTDTPGIPLELVKDGNDHIDQTLKVCESSTLTWSGDEGMNQTCNKGNPGQSSSDPIPSSFKVYLSTGLSLKALVEELGPAFLKEVNVIDMSLSPLGFEEELLREITVVQDARLLEQCRSLHLSIVRLQEELQQSKESVLDLVISSPCTLLQIQDFLPKLSDLEESQWCLQHSLEDMGLLHQQRAENLEPYVASAEAGRFVYCRLQEVSLLSPRYCFSARAILHWAQESLQSEKGVQALRHGTSVEKVLTQGILAHALPTLISKDRHLLQVLLAVGQPPLMEWLSFLGLVHRSAQGALSSCIQRPQWVGCQAWEELSHLEKLPAFRGIRSSLSTQSSQWQEYFGLSSTVIGPLPCAHFHHLTLFQTAILWRILRPLSLGLMLSHLTTCILGPAPTVETDIISLTDPCTPIVFLLPRLGSPELSSYPLPQILQMAKENKKEVRILTGQSCSDSHACDMYVTCQKEGHWLLLNSCDQQETWGPKMVGALQEMVQSQGVLASAPEDSPLKPGFHLLIIVQEEKWSSLPVCVRHSSLHVRCTLSSDICSALRTESPQDLVDETQRDKALHLLILHNVLLRRQQHSRSAQAETYSWGHEEFSVALRVLQRVVSVCEDWEEGLRVITGAVIYGGHIVDEGDAESVLAVTEQCLRDCSRQLRKCGLYSMPSAVLGSTLPGSWVREAQRRIQNSSPWEPEALGLSEGLPSTELQDWGRSALSDLLLTQNEWCPQSTQSTPLTCKVALTDPLRAIDRDRPRPPTPEQDRHSERDLELLCGQLLDHLMELREQPVVPQEEQPGVPQEEQPVVPQEEQPGVPQEEQPGVPQEEQPVVRVRGCPLRTFLLQEWTLLSDLITQSVQELEDAKSSCQCERCQHVRNALCRGFLPHSWNRYPSSTPLTPLAWVQGLSVRSKLLWSYLSAPSHLNMEYNLSTFQHPVRLLHSVLQKRAQSDQRDLEQYSLQVQVSGRLPAARSTVGVLVTGVHLQHALWDTRLGALQETLSQKLCPLPTVRVSAVLGSEMVDSHDASLSIYHCPMYLKEAMGGPAQPREEAVLLLPLPTRIPPMVWSQRRTHAISLL
ncbi:dynein heavy chain domain-containing protein 1 [Discoglossus pictus]